jgi:hypothetical protein
MCFVSAVRLLDMGSAPMARHRVLIELQTSNRVPISHTDWSIYATSGPPPWCRGTAADPFVSCSLSTNPFFLEAMNVQGSGDQIGKETKKRMVRQNKFLVGSALGRSKFSVRILLARTRSKDLTYRESTHRDSRRFRTADAWPVNHGACIFARGGGHIWQLSSPPRSAGTHHGPGAEALNCRLGKETRHLHGVRPGPGLLCRNNERSTRVPWRSSKGKDEKCYFVSQFLFPTQILETTSMSVLSMGPQCLLLQHRVTRG